MGLNFKKITKAKVGNIIPPAYNGTNGFWQTPRWDLVIGVDKNNSITKVRYIWDYETVNAIELMQLLNSLKQQGG